MKGKIFILITILLISRASFSEKLVIGKLRHEPASMYDLGVVRLDLYLNRNWVGTEGITNTEVSAIKNIRLSAINNEDTLGKIFIRLWFNVGFFENEKQKCKKIINTFRQYESIMRTDNSSALSSFFTHTEYAVAGYDLDNSSDEHYSSEFLKKINNMFIIEAVDYESEIICWGSYTGKDLNIHKW